MNHVVRGLMRQVFIVSAVLGILLASNAWSLTIDTTVGTPGTFNFNGGFDTSLQIFNADATAAMGGDYPNNTQIYDTQTLGFSLDSFQIQRATTSLPSLENLLLLMTTPGPLPVTYSFTVDPGNTMDPANFIAVDSTNFGTTSGSVSTSGDRPGNGPFNDFGGSDVEFAFLNLLGSLPASGGFDVGVNFGIGGPVVPITFFAYGVDEVGDPLRFTSLNDLSLTVLPGEPPPPVIPEPGTLLLIGSGLVGLGLGARRRKKS